MSWCRLESSLRTHHKIGRLAYLMKIPHAYARGLMCSLWSWATEARPDGDLAGMTDMDIAYAADWPDEPSVFVRAARESGFIDPDNKLHRFLERHESYTRAQREKRRRDENTQNTQNQPSTDKSGTRVQHSGSRVPGEEREEREEREDKEYIVEPDSTPTANAAGPVACATTTKTPTTDIDRVVEAYKRHHPHARPGDKVRKMIAARLRDGNTPEMLIEAIDGLHLSPFHQGDNDRGEKYLALKIAVRDSDQVEKFIAIARHGPPQKPSTGWVATTKKLMAESRAATLAKGEEVQHFDPDAWRKPVPVRLLKAGEE